ncbi:MAG: DUF3014 domain-containing protein [Rhodoferax sp.]
MTTVQIRNAVITATILAAAAGAYWWFQRSAEHSQPTLVVAPVVASAAVTEAPVAPVVAAAQHYPVVDDGAPHNALPTLDTSDQVVVAALVKLEGHKSFSTLLRPASFIRNIVATVDNLPRAQVAREKLPVEPLGGHFDVVTVDGVLRLGPANATRFRPLVDALQWIRVPALMDLYAMYYPLFQAAYVELGYPKGYFNDRLVVALDDLLTSPRVDGPVELTQSKVLYEFADPALASRSAGQKIMLRMGAENASKVKAFLAAVRDRAVHMDRAVLKAT